MTLPNDDLAHLAERGISHEISLDQKLYLDAYAQQPRAKAKSQEPRARG